jgi:hypothetical protein
MRAVKGEMNAVKDGRSHRLKRQSKREGCLDMRTASARFACCKPTMLSRSRFPCGGVVLV